MGCACGSGASTRRYREGTDGSRARRSSAIRLAIQRRTLKPNKLAEWCILLRQRFKLTYLGLTRRNGTRTGNSNGDGGRAGTCGRGGEFARWIFCGAQGLATAIPAIFSGAGRGLHAGGCVRSEEHTSEL